MRAINIRLLPEPAWSLLNRYQIAQRAKAPVADAAHEDQMFGASKWAVLFAMFDDALSQTFPDSGKAFQLLGRGGVDVDSLRLWLS